ncbi:MAG: hypothetical protein KF770_05250 [Anaerolineae bacterium]|nr:hypothetical protein [Anaerolineae bacterium]
MAHHTSHRHQQRGIRPALGRFLVTGGSEGEAQTAVSLLLDKQLLGIAPPGTGIDAYSPDIIAAPTAALMFF